MLRLRARRVRLAGRLARDLWPQGRVGRFLLEIFEWKRDHGEEAAIQNSIEWAEQWRARQQMRIAAAAMERAFELARAVMPGQRSLWPGL